MLIETALAGPGGFAAGAAFAYGAPNLVRRRGVAFRRAAASVAAVAAAAAGTQPTGFALPDLVFPAALAGALTLLAARAKPWTVTVVAGLTALASVTSGLGGVIGFAAFGIALATALTARRAPVAMVVVGAGVVNALLRLRLPAPMGTESLVAAVLLAVVCFSGYRRLQRTTRRRARRGAIVVGLATAAFALLGITAVAIARPGLERGAADAAAGLKAAKAADQQRATQRLESSGQAFDAAAGTLGGLWVRPAALVPVVSQHIRAVTSAANSGRELAAAGSQVARATDLAGVRIKDGRIPLDPIRALAAPLAAAKRDVSRAVTDLREVRSPWLVGPVAVRLDDNLRRLSDTERSLGTSAKLVKVLPDLLGAGGERRWFLAVQTPSEARATGGFIGNFGEVTTTDGKLALPRFGRLAELNTGGDPASRTLIGPPDYVARYQRFEVATTWQNVNLSPDFPSVARVIGGLYPQSGGQPIQGVLAIDPAGIAAFLRLTGPLTVPSWPEPITPENAERILLYEQYVRFGDGAERVDFLGNATRLLWERITTGDLPPPQEILRVLGPAVEGKHLLVSSLDDSEDAALAEAGLNGRVGTTGTDSLAVISQNASGSKIDWFLEREVDYRIAVDDAGALNATLDISLRNTAPPAGLPEYLIGNALTPPLPRGTSRLYVSIYTPWNLSGARLAGVPVAMESESELGLRVYSTFLDVPPQGSVVLALDLLGTVDPRDPYVVGLHAQPVAKPDDVAVTFAPETGNTASRRTALTRDVAIRFPRLR